MSQNRGPGWAGVTEGGASGRSWGDGCLIHCRIPGAEHGGLPVGAGQTVLYWELGVCNGGSLDMGSSHAEFQVPPHKAGPATCVTSDFLEGAGLVGWPSAGPSLCAGPLADPTPRLGSLAAPPTFTETPPQYIEAKEGSSITMTCTAFGNPKPIVTWLKEGMLLGASGKYQVSVGLPRPLHPLLLALRLRPRDSSHLRRRRWGWRRQAERLAPVSSEGEACFRVPRCMGPRPLPPGMGLAGPGLGAEPISPWPQVSDGSLTVTSVSREDRGAYTCRAYSIQGEAIHTTHLLVQGESDLASMPWASGREFRPH